MKRTGASLAAILVVIGLIAVGAQASPIDLTGYIQNADFSITADQGGYEWVPPDWQGFGGPLLLGQGAPIMARYSGVVMYQTFEY